MTTPSDIPYSPSSPSDTTSSQEPSPELLQRIERLAREQAEVDAKERKALLLFESALLRERAQDEPGAARDHLSAYAADSSFRESVETLAALLQRRASHKNLGKLLDALARGASLPEQAARALLEQGAFLLDQQQDVDGARLAWEQAVSEQPDLAAAWLQLELIAGKSADADLRMRAFEQRIRSAEPDEWKALLLIDLARMTHQQGQVDAALDIVREAAALVSPARFRAELLREELARKEGLDDVLAEALQAQAELVLDAVSDAAAGDAMGVPLRARNAGNVADLFLRAASARRRTGDTDAWVALLDRGLSRLPDDAVLTHARLRAAEVLGDVESASSLARKLIDLGADGSAASSLWLRVFEAAAATGQRDAALEALSKSLTADPGGIVARSLQIDLLLDVDPAAFASSLEAMADQGLSDDGKGRAYLHAAWAWATQAKDSAGAKAALSQAGMCGVSPGTVARVARALASLTEDDAWFEESTRRLVAAGAQEGEHASLWFELARARLLRGDGDGAAQALDSLAAAPGGVWLGRMLGAYALKLGAEHPAGGPADALEQLAAVESEPLLARAIRVVAAVRRARAGELDACTASLRELHDAEPSDVFVAVLLVELLRASNQVAAAAQVLSSCARASDDAELSTALHVQAGILLWRAQQRALALEAFHAARAERPEVVASILVWATAASDPDSAEARRTVLELGEESASDRIAIALERFAVESAEGGDPSQASAALEVLERDALGELSIAGWVGRLVSSDEAVDVEARSLAFDGLEALGLKASAVIAAERYRIARTEEQDRDRARDFAQAWALADGGPVAALEWLAAGKGAEDPDAQASARRLLARHVAGAASGALMASAALVELLASPAGEHPMLLDPSSPAERLMNLELAPAGCDPRRRASALSSLGDELGVDARLDAWTLAGWSQLAQGDAAAALSSFQAVTGQRPDDLAAWEGLRSAAEAANDLASKARACERLGELCSNVARSAEFFETAGLLWIDSVGDPNRGELALRTALDRDPERGVAFDKLFRRVRARSDNDLLLQLIGKRLEVANDTREIAKMFWEQARVLRQKNDFDGAMAALENVTMLEHDHVGALALTAEVHIRRGEFDAAVDSLARLAAHPVAPGQQRLVSGMAAVDLCEHRLNDVPRALSILLKLQDAGLSTLPLRERLARAAAHAESWEHATQALSSLWQERPTADGRIEAARLAMTICRDKLHKPAEAREAVFKLLDESHADAEALGFLIEHPEVGDSSSRQLVFERARRTLVATTTPSTLQVAKVDLLVKVATAERNAPARQAALGALVALGRGSDQVSREIEELDRRVARNPQVAIDDAAIAAIGDARDSGPIVELFRLMPEVIAEALGPTITGLGVSKRERIDPRDGLPLRNEIAHWAGALRLDFELYVGGRDPRGVVGVPGTPPVLVVGNQITAPLSPSARQAVARELFAIKRGISVVRTRDDATVASIVIGLCRIAEVPIEAPNYAMLAEVQKLLSKALPRRLKKVLPEYCNAVAASRVDPRAWVGHALSSLDRMAAIAAGDVSLVVADVFSMPRDQLASVCTDNERARRLISFVLSDRYLELRAQLGMGVR